MEHVITHSDKNRALDILQEAFYQVPGIMWIIRSRKYRKQHLRLFLSFCFTESAEKNGAYITSDKNGVVLFYNLQSKSRPVLKFLRMIYLMIKVIGIKRSLRALKTRKIMDHVRPKKGWYGWFLATEKGVIGNRAGYEIKRDMFRIADEQNENIYVETTDKRTMLLYKTIGFSEYAVRDHPYEDLNIWFMKREPNTVKT
ncbi:MAG TPA: hypothetical protein VM012_15640 [Flavitalea sp.]|nr:hypothetical protein [Flavitalea sp.]